MTLTHSEFTEGEFPKRGRLIGIDFGTVRVGVAICDENQSISSPLETYQRRNEKLDGQYFVKLVADSAVVGFVVGLPLHMSGDESAKSIEAREFGQWLSKTTRVPVRWVDERYSTAFAREMLRESKLSAKKKKSRVDKLAAQAILMAYLESKKKGAADKALDDEYKLH